MHTVGDNTRDHITLGTQHPAETGLPTGERETSILRYSHRLLAAGVTILISTYLATLTIALITDNNSALNHPVGRLFAVIGFNTLHSLGAALILIAGLERITRPMRTWIRQAAILLTDLREEATKTTALVADEVYSHHYTRKEIAAAGARLNELTAAVNGLPKYGEVIADGYRLGRHSAGLGDLDQLADPGPGRSQH